MAYGLEIYNNSNEFQVDGTYTNFSLHDSGSWSISSGFTWCGFLSTIKPPILAIQPPTTYCYASNYQKNASSEYYTTLVYADGAITLPYIVFTESANAEIPTGAYGLVVYNANNELVFHNYNKWCRVIAATTFLSPLKADCSGGITSADVTVTDAYNHHFILRPTSGVGIYNTQQNVTYYYTVLMKTIDSLTIRIGVVNTGAYSGNSAFCYGTNYLNLIEIST